MRELVHTAHIVYRTLSTSLTLFNGILGWKGEPDALEGVLSNGAEAEFHI
jgi:hypothetical protein